MSIFYFFLKKKDISFQIFAMLSKILTTFSFPRNTFVLEYCGEVLDHKEFKTRVKEYARNKNIHYYFMSLKNNEVSKKLAPFQIFITISSR